MGEDTAPKGAQKPKKHGKNPTRKSIDEHRILNAKPVSPEFLAAAIHELSIKFSPSSTFLTITIIMATISAVFPQSQAIQSIQQPQPIREILPPPPRQLVKTSVKCRTSEFQSVAVFRGYHANHRRVSHGVRD
jgi:hypothetical protein